MATVDDVARQVLAAIDTTAGHVLAGQWVSQRYQRLASRARFRHLRQVGEIIVPATMSTGTVAVTQGSRVVTGDATAQASWLAVTGLPGSSMVGRYFRQANVWYVIAAVNATQLILSSPFVETTNAAGAYTVVQRYTRLDGNARWLGTFVHARRRIEVLNVALSELDTRDPERMRANMLAGPYVWAEVNADVDGTRRLEFYPYSAQTELIGYVYWSTPAELKLDSIIPGQVDSYVLQEGALIDAMRFEAARAARIGQPEMAAYWRNEYRSQATSWERQVLEAIRADKGIDDMTMVLQLVRSSGWGVGDITNARDMVYDRWPL